MFVLANLNDEQVHRLQAFEAEKGIRVLALQDVPVEPAPLAQNDLDSVQELEAELGLCLVAVE